MVMRKTTLWTGLTLKAVPGHGVWQDQKGCTFVRDALRWYSLIYWKKREMKERTETLLA